MQHSDLDDMRALVQRLTRDRRNLALPGIVATHAALWGSLVALYFWPSWPAAVAAFLLVGVLQYRLVMSCHEAVHKTLVFPLALNEFLGVFHGALVGLNFIRYRRQHLHHHRAETMADDPDGYIYGPILAAAPGWRRVATWTLGVPAEILEKFKQKGLGAGNEDVSNARRARVHSLVMVGVNGALFIALTLAFGWYGYLALWLLPLLVLPLFLNRTRILVEHGYVHVRKGSRVLDRAAATVETIDLSSSASEAFVLAPYAFNFHGAHHRYPSVPHYNLAELASAEGYRVLHGANMVKASYVRALVDVLGGMRTTV
jgi:fatty acid desaturase